MSTTTWRGVDAPVLPGAACTLVDPDLFHPVKLTRPAATRAKRVCASCRGLVPCLRWALEHDEDLGVWGATTPTEREKIRDQLDKGVPFAVAAGPFLPNACATPAAVPETPTAGSAPPAENVGSDGDSARQRPSPPRQPTAAAQHAA